MDRVICRQKWSEIRRWPRIPLGDWAACLWMRLKSKVLGGPARVGRSAGNHSWRPKSALNPKVLKPAFPDADYPPQGRCCPLGATVQEGAMGQGFLGLSGVLVLGAWLMACGFASGPRDSTATVAPPSLAPPVSVWALPTDDWPGAKDESAPGRFGSGKLAMGRSVHPAAGESSYCQAKFGHHAVAFDGCQRFARESYRKLEPAFERASMDSMAMESKRLEGCMRRHDGPLGLDWILVEHCFSRSKP